METWMALLPAVVTTALFVATLALVGERARKS